MLPGRLPVALLVACLIAHLFSRVLACLRASLLACLLACLLAFLLARLLDCLLVPAALCKAAPPHGCTSPPAASAPMHSPRLYPLWIHLQRPQTLRPRRLTAAIPKTAQCTDAPSTEAPRMGGQPTGVPATAHPPWQQRQRLQSPRLQLRTQSPLLEGRWSGGKFIPNVPVPLSSKDWVYGAIIGVLRTSRKITIGKKQKMAQRSCPPILKHAELGQGRLPRGVQPWGVWP